MAIFSLQDLTYNTPVQILGGTEYENNIFRYPIDLGASDKGHYMIIHINAQKKTQVAERREASDNPTIYDNRLQSGNLGIGGIFGELIGGAGSLFPESVQQIFDDFIPSSEISLGFVRTIYRTTDTIALYMPDTLAFTQNQSYSDLSLIGAIPAGLAIGAGAIDSYNNSGGISGQIRNLSPFVAAYAATQNSFLTAAFAAVTGTVINPMLEVIYTSPQFRMFRFDFMFYPRSQQEAQQVQGIVERLRFHQSPEIKKDSYGFFLIPPSEFDIKFYYNGVENENIPKISTCILESLDLDYAPQGFAAYEVPGQYEPTVGGTGMPVGMRLSLNFKETEYLTKDNYQQL